MKRMTADKKSDFSYVVRVGRIELPSTAWKAVILPLNYTRMSIHSNKFITQVNKNPRPRPRIFDLRPKSPSLSKTTQQQERQ